MRRRFPHYEQYGKATIEDVFTEEELEGAYLAEAQVLASIYLENRGTEGFAWKTLPRKAQVAPVFGALAGDFTGDGNPDVLLSGNDYGTELVSGRHDAFTGLLLAGNGAGDFHPVPLAESGFLVTGDAKGMASLHDPTGRLLVVTGQNQDRLKVFRKTSAAHPIRWQPDPQVAAVEITMADGSREYRELYYGSSFLSGVSRWVDLDPERARQITLYYFDGSTRKETIQMQEKISEGPEIDN